MSEQREFDLVLFGATGFTGRMVARYLAEHAPAHLRWALAGRSRDKLEAVRSELRAGSGAGGAGAVAADVPDLVIADVSDPASLAALAARTRVVLTTVGPFIDYGEPLVAACVSAGTDYIDSTGEIEFHRQMVERYDAAAVERGVRLICACGFDSIPTDLGVYYTVRQLPSDKPIAIEGYMAFQGVFSGGTQASAIKSLAGRLPEPDDYVLERDGRTARILKARFGRESSLSAWVTPFETVDPPIVLRSAAALRSYGPAFTYTHHMVHPSFMAAFIVVFVIGLTALMARVAPLKRMLLKGIKPSGEGPTQAEMDAGWFRLRLKAECDGQQLTTQVSGRDPGYRETSMMLAQSALCLIEDRASLPDCAGLVSPAEALGDALLARLQASGMRFETLSSPA